MILTGTVEDVIFRNNENMYSILRVKTGLLPTIVTGTFPIIGAGEEIEVEGDWQNNPRYGKQFVARSVKLHQPSTEEAIIKYLSMGLISGVGAATAAKIVGMFKTDTLKVLEESPEKLTAIKGISERKAMEIGKGYQNIRKMQDAMFFLQSYEVSVTTAVKIYEAYKERTEQVLKTNPYKLVEDVEGIGFKTADRIASKMGVSFTSDFRIRAGLIYCLSEWSDKQGSTVIKTSQLVESTMGLLELPVEYEGDILKQLTSLMLEGIIKETYLGEDEAISYSKLYNLEKFIASKLKILIDSAPELNYDFEREISEFERVNKLSFHESQIKAITSAVKEGVSVITGGPGTGKTTIIKAVLSILENHGKKCVLFAPTGRAAKRLEEQTKKSASTIHRGLGMAYNGGRLSFTYNERNPLDAEVVIVDEVSMIDVYIASSLLKALRPGTKLILVGDKDQLMSVGAGNVLGDIIASGIVCVLELTQIFRQAEGSAIVTNAHLINKGEMPDLMKKSSDFFYSSTSIPSEVANEVVGLVSSRITAFCPEIQPQNIQVLTPMKAGEAGATNLNLLLREKLNPKDPSKAELELHKVVFREGDKVMQVQNNYDLEYVKTEGGITTYGSGVFNGDMGYIDQINKQSGEVYVIFDDGREAIYSIVELADLVHAYAITVHKSQGSEFDAVIIPIVGGNPMLYTKNLLYTAVTRAKKMVILIGKKTNIFHMIKNEGRVKRYTNLKKFLESSNIL